MMRSYLLIGLAAAAVLLSACAGNSSVTPAAERTLAEPAPIIPLEALKSVLDGWDSGDVPDPFLKRARGQFFGVYFQKDEEEARNNLRLAILGNSLRLVSENRAYMIQNDWQPEFIEEFDKIVLWHRRLREVDPKEVYELARAFQSNGAVKSNDTVAENIFLLAGARGYLEGFVEYARISLDGDRSRKSDGYIGRFWLWAVAGVGFVPAQLEIAERYLNGRGFKRNRAKALYWLRRAEMKGAEVGKRMEALKKETSPKELEQVMRWLSNGYTPDE